MLQNASTDENKIRILTVGAVSPFMRNIALNARISIDWLNFLVDGLGSTAL